VCAAAVGREEGSNEEKNSKHWTGKTIVTEREFEYDVSRDQCPEDAI
jgi:hypothetical protein